WITLVFTLSTSVSTWAKYLRVGIRLSIYRKNNVLCIYGFVGVATASSGQQIARSVVPKLLGGAPFDFVDQRRQLCAIGATEAPAVNNILKAGKIVLRDFRLLRYRCSMGLFRWRCALGGVSEKKLSHRGTNDVGALCALGKFKHGVLHI